jgi:hypothetical protein
VRILACVSVALAVVLASAAARANVTEPNGLAVPIDSSPEEQLYTLFSSRGENINWQTDAHPTPNQFSPLCGFTATYVLNQAGSHFGLAWYNDTGTTPTAAELHQLVAANSAVGTTFSGTVIKNDPAYTGGVVGFALIGGETHYTNDAYDQSCTSCSPPGPWITALMYASTVTPDAYYICFEDGSTSANGWNNDGDFNDDVYFVTGISCSGGGQPCDTGKPGICAAGLTQCAAGGTTCQELNPPAPSETCNGLDDNCDGQTDEGNPCPEEYVCQQGTCVKSCAGSEFPCPVGLVCNAKGYCVDPACENVTCPSGQVCTNGVCKAPCDGVTCPFPEVCRVGKCVDPCASVTCNAGQICDDGVCVASCNCQPCGQGLHCDTTSGQCVTQACATVTCGAGTHCVSGTCADDCAGAVCPSGQACSKGVCVEVPDAGAGDGGGGITNPTDGGTSGAPDGSTTDAGAGAGGDAGEAPLGQSKAACACSSVGAGGGGDAMLASAVAALVLVRLRRRKSRSQSRTPHGR